MTTTWTRLTAAALLATGGTQAFALGDHADVLVGAKDGKIVTLAEEPAENFFLSQVFEGEFPDSFFTDDPGFNNDELDEFPNGIGALQPDTDVNFNIKAITPLTGSTAANLFYWDGEGSASFAAVTDGTSLTVSRQTGGGSFDTAVADGGNSDVTGYTIDTTSSTGTLHKHIDFYLLDDDAATDDIAEGVYVLPLELTQAGLDSSDPFFLVFATETIGETQHEAAVDHVQTAFVPEPTSLALLGLGGTAMLLRRRRHAAT